MSNTTAAATTDAIGLALTLLLTQRLPAQQVDTGAEIERFPLHHNIPALIVRGNVNNLDEASSHTVNI